MSILSSNTDLSILYEIDFVCVYHLYTIDSHLNVEEMKAHRWQAVFYIQMLGKPTFDVMYSSRRTTPPSHKTTLPLNKSPTRQLSVCNSGSESYVWTGCLLRTDSMT